MNLGPRVLIERLEKLLDTLSFLVEPSINFLERYKERIETFHRAAVIHVFSCGFPVIFCISTTGSVMAAVVLSDPFTKSPSPYRMEVDTDRLIEAFERSYGEFPASVRSGIFEFPPRTRFIAVAGDGDWIKKELFQESVKGRKFVSFAENVNEEVYRTLERLNSGKISSLIYSSVDDEGIHMALVLPDGFPQEHASLLSEMGKVLREKMGLSPSKLSKISSVPGKVLVMFSVPLEDIKKDPFKIAFEMEERILKGYRSFLEGAGLA